MLSSFNKTQFIRYWGRKPLEQIEPYILEYSKEGEVVLDPFAGSGSTIMTALINRRRAIYNDLNQVAMIIAKANILRQNVDVKLSKRYKDLYMVNGKEVSYYIWEGDKIIKAKLVDGTLIDYQGKDYDGDDLILWWYPQNPLYYLNGKTFDKRRNVTRVDELFTKRNLLILSEMHWEIERQYNIKSIVAFISILHETSKMARLGGGAWGLPCYWVPYKRIEKNPYILFEKKLKMVNEVGGNYSVGRRDDVIQYLVDVAFWDDDAKKLGIPDNSIDLIVTDPPFFDEIQYFELSYLAATWIGAKVDFYNEIVVNHGRDKDETIYLKDLEKAISEMHRVLKKDRHVIIMFHEEEEDKMKEIKNVISSFFTIEKEDIKTMQQRAIGDRITNSKGRELKVFIAKK